MAATSGGLRRKPGGRSASTQVADMLRAAIVNRELLPGEQVRQQEWAERANISRPPLREALEILTHEGLLEHSLNRGYFVAKISLHEMRQLYVMRMLLEKETAQSVVWPTKSQLSDLQYLAEKASAAERDGDPTAHRERVEEFLLAVHALSTDQLIRHAVTDLWARTSAYRALAFEAVKYTLPGEGAVNAVLKALDDRDRAALCEALLEPTAAAFSYIERHLAR
jgi:DNA-binding GntR family transcriptional regulator